MITKNDLQNLANLTALQLAGFIVLEVIMWALIALNIVPPTLVLKQIGVVTISINTAFIVVVGLVSVLIAAFWLAVLVEFDLIKMGNVNIRFS